MTFNRNQKILSLGILSLIFSTLLWMSAKAPEQSFIVQGKDIQSVTRLIESVGGQITHSLPIIKAIGAILTEEQKQTLLSHADVRKVYADRGIENDHAKNKKGDDLSPDSDFASRIEADLLHQDGINGQGITIAFIDTGIDKKLKNLETDIDKDKRILVQYDAIKNKIGKSAEDESGHGSHVASIATSSEWQKDEASYAGIAPNADIVSVKAFDKKGQGSYSDVIRALDWIVTNKDIHNIRVLNLSFSATPESHYWDDPLNQAVMATWQAGIVVVASAGNAGPEAMSIGVPGNVPYIITVGAMSDNKTSLLTDDLLAEFSSAGPTVEGFVKPEIVAPGSRLLGLMKEKSKLGKTHKTYFDSKDHFAMSGTSQATAVVTGTVALMLQQDPSLTPDMVKCKLMSSAQPALTSTNELAYSVFQQGAGMVNAYQAAHNTDTDCANNSLDIEMDLQGQEHYAGPARRDQNGNYYVEGSVDYSWDGSYTAGEGYAWIDPQATDYNLQVTSLWLEGYLWENGYLWSDSYIWKDGYMWRKNRGNTNGYMWRKNRGNTNAATIAINAWVEE